MTQFRRVWASNAEKSRQTASPGLRILVRAIKNTTYGTMYGMQKTTVYLPEELKRALGRVASRRGMSEAELIREALRAITMDAEPPKPRLPLFESGLPDLAERVDTALDGFGEA